MDVQRVPPGPGPDPGRRRYLADGPSARSERPVNTRAASEVGISLQMARRLVSLAIRAPSVHNTQPWAWRIGPDGIDLFADESRRLAASDPMGRNLVISCGAALHHLRAAARASGLRPEVVRLPDPADPGLLAQVTFTPTQPPRRQPPTYAPSRSAAPTVADSPRGRFRTGV